MINSSRIIRNHINHQIQRDHLLLKMEGYRDNTNQIVMGVVIMINNRVNKMIRVNKMNRVNKIILNQINNNNQTHNNNLIQISSHHNNLNLIILHHNHYYHNNNNK